MTDLQVGDHIAKINGESVVGCPHFATSQKLKNIPDGSRFEIILVEPQKPTNFHFNKMVELMKVKLEVVPLKNTNEKDNKSMIGEPQIGCLLAHRFSTMMVLDSKC